MRGKITRTFTHKKFKVEVYNKMNKEVEEFVIEMDGRIPEKKNEKEIENQLSTNYKLLDYEFVCTVETLYSMDEEEFIQHATIEKIDETK